MPDPTTAIIGGSIGSGILGFGASKSAANAQTRAAAQADATQRYMFDESTKLTEPWRRVGTSALYSLEDLMGLSTPASRVGRAGLTAPTREQFTTNTPASLGGTWVQTDRSGPRWEPSVAATPEQLRIRKMLGLPDIAAGGSSFDKTGYDAATAEYERALAEAGIERGDFGSLNRRFTMADFETDPGYEFRLAEGEKAINRAALARGGYDSGGTLKALTRFGQDYATNEYGNSYNRWNADNDRIFNRLSGVAGTGQTSATQVGQNAMTLGTNLANTQLQAGNSRGAGIVGQANAITGAMSSGMNQYMGLQYIDALKNLPSRRFTMADEVHL